jgi:hypothetical protein
VGLRHGAPRLALALAPNAARLFFVFLIEIDDIGRRSYDDVRNAGDETGVFFMNVTNNGGMH